MIRIGKLTVSPSDIYLGSKKLTKVYWGGECENLQDRQREFSEADFRGESNRD
jgi:hypothetical protein